MKLTLRAKFMLWLTAQTLVGFALIGIALFFFNQHEQREHPDAVAEEQEELLVIYGLMAAVLPIVLGGAWIVSGQLLKPLQTMLRDARQIGEGQLEQRLEAPVAADELGQLARTLNGAFDNYRRVLQRLDRFSLDAAHQLRNPLAGMRTAAEVSLQHDRTPAEYQETLGRMLEEARRLSHTVEQLLLLARLTRQNLEEVFTPVDLAALVRQMSDNVAPVFEDRGINLSVRVPEPPVFVRGAARLLEEAVANVLDNALRFTPASGQVAVELQTNAAKRVALSVADSGPGLSQQQLDGALNQDVPTSRQSREGTGLGLLVVGDVVRAHEGVVHASRSQWGGACLTIELPWAG